jgi:N-acetyl-alpha-D-glucosaminyl L-malate synthase BshA
MASDGVTVPSAYLGDVARRTLQLGDDRDIEVIPNFVDTDHFRPAEPQDRQVLAALFPGDQPALQPNERILVHVSNFRPVKRVPDVIEVFARVAEQRPARLLLVGDGPERGLVARRVRALGLQQRVCFLGSMVEFADYLRHADLFLLPSETESFGLAALEALACGVPVLASDVGGLPSVVQDGQTGRLTPVRDVQAMSEAALSLLEDESARKAMAVRARQDVLQRFSQGPALDRYERYYRRVLSEHQCQETP